MEEAPFLLFPGDEEMSLKSPLPRGGASIRLIFFPKHGKMAPLSLSQASRFWKDLIVAFFTVHSLNHREGP